MVIKNMGSNLDYIDKIIETELIDFSVKLLADYSSKGKKVINLINKKNNLFIASLGKDITLYSALMRSLDSSLGNRIEKIAKIIAEKNYFVKQKVYGYISEDSINAIAKLLESYKNNIKPKANDVESIYRKATKGKKMKRYSSDYYMILKSDSTKKFLVELKIGGDLDNKKARSEKEALLEQYVILRNSNEIKPEDNVKIFFCTAYNKDGDENYWKQERVRQFFSDNELKIGKDFWNFFCNSTSGYDAVKKSYLKHSHYLKTALRKIVAIHV